MPRVVASERDHVDRAALRAALSEWSEIVHPDAASADVPNGERTSGVLRSVVVKQRGRRTPVLTRPFVKGETRVDRLVESIANAIEADALLQAGNGPQAYLVEAYYGDETFARDTHPVPIDVDSDDAAPGGGGGDAKGALRAMQKVAHDAIKEGTKRARQVDGYTLSSLAHAETYIDRLHKRITELETRLDAQFEDLQQARDRTLDRQLAAERAKQASKMLGELFAMAKNYAPILSNKFLGTEFPVLLQRHPVMDQFRALYDELSKDPKVIERLGAALADHPHALAQMLSLMGELQDQAKLENERARVHAELEAKVSAPALADGSAAPRQMGAGA